MVVVVAAVMVAVKKKIRRGLVFGSALAVVGVIMDAITTAVAVAVVVVVWRPCNCNCG